MTHADRKEKFECDIVSVEVLVQTIVWPRTTFYQLESNAKTHNAKSKLMVCSAQLLSSNPGNENDAIVEYS